MHPHHAAVLGNEPVLLVERLTRSLGLVVRRQHPVPVVGVQQAGEVPGVVDQLLRCVAEDRFALGADEREVGRVGLARRRRLDEGHGRDLLDQRPVPCLRDRGLGLGGLGARLRLFPRRDVEQHAVERLGPAFPVALQQHGLVQDPHDVAVLRQVSGLDAGRLTGGLGPEAGGQDARAVVGMEPGGPQV